MSSEDALQNAISDWQSAVAQTKLSSNTNVTALSRGKTNCLSFPSGLIKEKKINLERLIIVYTSKPHSNSGLSLHVSHSLPQFPATL